MKTRRRSIRLLRTKGAQNEKHTWNADALCLGFFSSSIIFFIKRRTKSRINEKKVLKNEKMGFIHIPGLFMQLGGMWPTDQIKDVQRKLMYSIYKYFVYTYFLIFDILLTLGCAQLVLQQKEFDRIVTASGLVVTLVVLFIKAITLQKNEIPQKLLLFLRAEKEILKSKDDEVIGLYSVTLKYCGYSNRCVIFLSIFTVLFFFIVDIFGNEGIINVGVEYWDFETRSFLHEIYFPFDKKKCFYLILVLNTVYSALIVFIYIACQCVMLAYIIFAITRLIILQISLEKLHILAKEAHVDGIVIMKKCIKEHQDLIRIIKTLNDDTKYLLLMDFLLNSFKVAFNLLKIMTAQSVFDLVYPIFYASMVTCEVVSIGWITNEIKMQSLAIADAAYQSLWYEQNEKTKRLLGILIMRAQKPLVLTIGPLQPMTTETIVTILKAAYTYVTLMMDS